MCVVVCVCVRALPGCISITEAPRATKQTNVATSLLLLLLLLLCELRLCGTEN